MFAFVFTFNSSSRSSYINSFIRHLHISHNAPYLPPPPLGITAVLREIENNAYAKCLGLNKMHYGRCVSGELYCFFHFKLLSHYGFSACKRYILML